MTTPWALITGASAGIGRELAQVFATEGFSLVLVARNEARLKALAADLRAARQTESRVLAQDLAQPDAAAKIFEAVRDMPVSVLVNNAGFGSYGPFAQVNLAVTTEMMQVNIVALTQLTNLFLQPMLQRGAGRILNVASTAAFQPGPLVNVYYASKAFVYSFSYALADELAGSGITVTALCPGMTRTEFFQRANIREKGNWPIMDARTVAQAGYRGLIKGKRVVIPGLMNQIASFFARRSPPWLTSAVVRRIHAKAAD
jgi:short-subunit dehydrogenase